MKQKLFTLLTLLVLCVTGAWAQTDYYTPTADEVIIIKDNIDNDGGTGKGQSTHDAFSFAAKITSAPSDKTAGDPYNNGAATSSTVKTYPLKGNGGVKNLTLTISGCSKLIVYHEKKSDRVLRAEITPDGEDMSIADGSKNTYYTEYELDGTKSYSIFIYGYTSSKQDLYTYAFKLIKYVAKTIDTQGLKSDNAVKVGTTALTKDAAENGYSISGTTITLTADQVAYSTPSNIKLVNHITYTDASSEDKDVAATFDGTITSGYYIGTATIGETTYTVRVPQGTEAITAVSINGAAISAADLATLQSEHTVSINGSALNGIGLIKVTLNSGAATVTRTNTDNNAIFTFTCNATEHTVKVTNVKKTYTALGNPVYFSKNGTNACGVNTKSVNANGITFTYPSKSFQYGSGSVTIGSDAYAPLKLSTGEATTVTFPEGVKATKVRVYGWSAEGDGKMYCIQETSDASSKKVDADQLAEDIYYATNTDKDIYPSVYEYELDEWESMYFSCGGSASQPFIVMDFELKDNRSTIGAQTLTWTPNVNTSESSIGTASKASSTSTLPVTDMGNIANNGSLSISSSAKTDLTSKIEAPSAYDADKYMSVTFKVADGCRFTPTSISVKVQPVSAKGDVKLVLTDGVNSIEKTQSDVASGDIATITESNSGKTTLTGTVTLKIYCYGSSTGTYRLGSPISIAGTMEQWIPSTIPANKEWITFCSTANLDFSSDIAGLEGAYTITAHADKATALTATKMTGKVKAGTGLLLRAKTVSATDAQAINIPVAATGEEQADNMLKGVTVDTEVQPTAGDYTNLGLSNGEFHPYSAAGTLAAGKAYLQVPTAQMPTGGNNARLYIVLDGEATGIANVDVNANDNFDNAPMYNLAGQKVTKSYKGVVIVNGKKYINK